MLWEVNMKIFLAAAMTLGILFILDVNQPARASIIQSVDPIIQKEQVIDAHWYHRGWGNRWGWHNWGWRRHHYPRFIIW